MVRHDTTRNETIRIETTRYDPIRHDKEVFFLKPGGPRGQSKQTLQARYQGRELLGVDAMACELLFRLEP